MLSSNILNEVFETAESLLLLSNGKLENLDSIKNLNEMYKDKLEDYLIERMRG